MLIWAPIVQVLWALLAALIAIACCVQLKRRVYQRIKRLVDEEGVPTESRNDIRRKRLRAAYAHRAERLLELLGGVTVVSVLLLLCLSATGLPPNALVSTLFPDWRSDLPHLVASLSLYVVLALSAGFVLLSSYVRRSEATRKAVGILWDLTTFWPRAAHPLSPPCYAERVVPELTTRIRWALKRDGTVVVSGHSQGSLIAAATLIRLEEDELDHVRFVTYGSQLRALYGRIFPRVLGPDVLGNEPTTGSRSSRTRCPTRPRGLGVERSGRPTGTPRRSGGHRSGAEDPVGPAGPGRLVQLLPARRPARLAGLLRRGLRPRHPHPRGAAEARRRPGPDRLHAQRLPAHRRVPPRRRQAGWARTSSRRATGPSGRSGRCPEP